MDAVEGNPSATRDPDLVLARLHLRLGSLALARAELETLAGRDALDEDGLVDLAEARWRTGDIAGAGEAAVAALDDEDGPLVALVVAAEAAAARGRPTEARRLADRAMAVAAGSIDELFAGMPRAGVWPPDAAAPPPSPTTMFDPPRRAIAAVHRHPRPHETPAEPEVGDSDADVADAGAVTGPSADADAATVGLWEAASADRESEATSDQTTDVEAADEAVAAAAHDRAVEEALRPSGTTAAAADLPTGDRELGLGRAALEADDPAEATVWLGLVLRIAPAHALAVLDLVEGRSEPGLALVRGDAYRLVGREVEARQAFLDAAHGPTGPPPVPDFPAGSGGPGDPPESGSHLPPNDPPSEGEPA